MPNFNPAPGNNRKKDLRNRVQAGGQTIRRDQSINTQRPGPGAIGPALKAKAAAMSQKPGPYANWQAGQQGPQQGPNIHGGNLKAKLDYLRQRRDAFQANPKTQTVSDGTTVTQSGGKQQAKIDYIKQQMKRRARAVKQGLSKQQTQGYTMVPRGGNNKPRHRNPNQSVSHGSR